MAFLTKRHLSRRTFLRGASVTLALPFLESMVPAGRVLGQAAAPPTRLGCIYFPHGAIMPKFTPATAGDWDAVGDRLVWRLRVQSKDALSLNFGFSEYVMPEGGHMLVYPAGLSRNASQELIRTFTSDDNKPHRKLWTPVVSGDHAVIEVVVPKERAGELRLRLTSVNHDYVGFDRLARVGMVLLYFRTPSGDVGRAETVALCYRLGEARHQISQLVAVLGLRHRLNDTVPVHGSARSTASASAPSV